MALISKNQSAFVVGRQIHDNIMIVQEVFHHLKLRKKEKKYKMNLKLDRNKAYDKVEWDFLKAILGKMGFAERWIKWIM